MAATEATVEATFREVYGRALGTLIRLTGDISTAEDAVQDAFEIAVVRWKSDGIPANPAGWVITTARNRAIDHKRRSARGRELERIAEREELKDEPMPTIDDGALEDDRLRLIFTCCHPALRREHQVALTLRLLGGLSVEEIAQAFLVSETAMARRIGRAKFKISAANIPYRVPTDADLPSRLAPVLTVLYLIYHAGNEVPNEGVSLRTEAIRLTRSLVALMPDEAEAAGLLALILLNESRVDARTSEGPVILLQDQDRSRWDRELIAEGHAIVRACIRRDQPGIYQLQAAIQAVHCNAPNMEATDWDQIVVLYDHLYSLSPSPVYLLNRSIALIEAEGPAAAIAQIDGIAQQLDGFYPLHLARATAYQRHGDDVEALVSFRRALELAPSPHDREYLQSQIDQLSAA